LTIGFVDRIHMQLIKFEINMNRLVSLGDKEFAQCRSMVTMTKNI